MSKIKILNLAIYYAPYNCVATFRNQKISKYLEEHSFFQYIFTSDFRDDINLELCKEIPNDSIVFRKKVRFPKMKSFSGFNVKPNLLSRMKYMIKDLIFSPDIFIWWILFYLPKMIKTIKKENIKIVLVSGHPVSAFIGGYFLKKICKVKLIIDLHDPWKSLDVCKKQGFIRRASDAFWEKKCINNADLITVAHESMRLEFLNEYNPKSEVLVIPNGFDYDDFSDILKTPKEQNQKFTFLYAGNYSLGIYEYNPTNLVMAYDLFTKKYNIIDSVLTFIGTTDDETMKFINSIGNSSIFCYGQQPKNEALKLQYQADVLIHFHYPNVNKIRVTLKICEYAILGKPILSFNVKEGTLYEFIKNNQLGESADSYNIDECIDLFYKAYKRYLTICEKPLERLDEYNYKNICTLLAKKIMDLHYSS